jgi:anchored repeat ABC transporter substrate-binding protein
VLNLKSTLRPIVAWAAVSLVIACSAAPEAGRASGGGPLVLSTSNVVADWIEQLAGDRMTVRSIVPRGGNPHAYAPGPRDVAQMADAQAIFAVGLTLESSWFDRLVKNAATDPARIVTLGAYVKPIPFDGEVRHASADQGVLFLGVSLDKVRRGALANDEVALKLTEFSGPGHFIAYSVDGFGEPVVAINTSDGISAADRLRYKAGEHAHLNWAFTAEGDYTVVLETEARTEGGALLPPDRSRYRFHVGADVENSLGSGHVDLRLVLADGDLRQQLFDEAYANGYATDAKVLVVRPKAATAIPDDRRFSFLGRAGATVWMLPQGQQASHQHGPEDPHFWFDPREVKRVLPAIVDRLSVLDPEGRTTFAANAETYGRQLDDLHTWIAQEVVKVPAERRLLVTAHESLGYLAKAYGFQMVGSVIPGVTTTREPTAAELAKLVTDIKQRKVPALFGETILDARMAQRIAEESGAKLVTGLHTDSLGQPGTHTENYLAMMRHTVRTIVDALK